MENRTVAVYVQKSLIELVEMENEFLKSVGEEPLSQEQCRRLEKAVNEEKIVFITAKADGRNVGVCSVSPCFSTFACKPCGVFDDFFVRPEYRGKGIARMLVSAAQTWCKEHGYASLTVGCAREDVGMYQSLGFDTELGTMLVNNL